MAARPVTPDTPLTDLDARFVDEFLKDLKQHEAYLRARGLTAPTSGSRSTAYNLRRKPNVMVAIDRAMVERNKRTLISQDEVIARLWMIATADPVEAVDERNVPLPLHQIPREHRLAIASHRTSVRPEQGGATIEVKYHDKVRTLLELLAHVKPKTLNDIPKAVNIDPAAIAKMSTEELDQLIANLKTLFSLA